MGELQSHPAGEWTSTEGCASISEVSEMSGIGCCVQCESEGISYHCYVIRVGLKTHFEDKLTHDYTL